MRDYLAEAKWLEEAFGRGVGGDQSATVTNEQQPEPAPIELVNQAMVGLPWLPEDKIFVCARLARLGLYGKQRRKVLKQYRCLWLSVSKREPSLIKKDNAGRRAANSWLRSPKRVARVKNG